ncbi:hypothetical protein PF008_g24202 [Phytophthora fragariae]|uniref:Uncharacterized protein n=1 Tax=Phytophthora fragariae TaxID=53985 RepID=A0A6G0QPE3_9STRA|nr:hypothetical protein PF008_g24202 [Phytophthora fragariae]
MKVHNITFVQLQRQLSPESSRTSYPTSVTILSTQLAVRTAGFQRHRASSGTASSTVMGGPSPRLRSERQHSAASSGATAFGGEGTDVASLIDSRPEASVAPPVST